MKRVYERLIVCGFQSCLVAAALLVLTASRGLTGESRYETSVRHGRTVRDDFRVTGFTLARYRPLIVSDTSGSWVPEDLGHGVNEAGLDWGVQGGLTHFSDSRITDRLDASLLLMLKRSFERFPSLYVRGGIGGAYNQLNRENNRSVDLRLGSDWFFMSQVGIGYGWEQGRSALSLETIWTHRSNAGLASQNLGLDVWLIQFSLTR